MNRLTSSYRSWVIQDFEEKTSRDHIAKLLGIQEVLKSGMVHGLAIDRRLLGFFNAFHRSSFTSAREWSPFTTVQSLRLARARYNFLTFCKNNLSLS